MGNSIPSNPPFHILRADSAGELEKLVAEARERGWELLGKIECKKVGDEERFYCQVIGPADSSTPGKATATEGE